MHEELKLKIHLMFKKVHKMKKDCSKLKKV